MITIICKKCQAKYKIPEGTIIKCNCEDPYPSAYDPGVPDCNCIEMPGDIICLSSCAQRQYLQPLQEAWSKREKFRYNHKVRI